MSTNESASPAMGPTPNTVCTQNTIFSGTLDVLANSEETQFRNGTCLVVEPFSTGLQAGDKMFNLALCGSKHVHLNLGLAIELGQCSVIVVAAYALALSYDRESWAAGVIPSTDNVKRALRDCLDVLRGVDAGYVEWLTQRTARQLADWTKAIKQAGGVLTPHAEVGGAEA